MHSMRRSYALALSVVLVLAAQADARMSDSKFQQLLDFSRQHLSHNFTVHEHFRLLFAALPVEEIGWASPDSIDQDRARAYEGTNFNVVLVHAPPLVVIDDPEAIELGDPGNIEQTRTIANEMLSGLVIDLLSHIQDSLGCTFKFYYPCARLNGTATTCNARDYSSVQSGLTMLDTARIDEDKYGLDGYENLKAQQDADDDVYYGGGPGLCPDNRCFVAANVAITAERMTRYFMTQPFLYKGFTLVVNSGDLKADFFSWMYPFVHFVWMLTVGVITVSTFAFCICEGYGVGNSLSEYKRNPFLLIIQSLQWSILLLLGAASRQPVTHAGRTLVMANLFFVVLWISVYTGNLNQFLLSVPYQTKVNRIEDFDPIKRTSMFSSRNTVCVPQQHPSVDSFLRILEEGYAGETIPRVNGTDLYDCLTKVYTGEATAAMFDQPIVLDVLKKRFFDTGYCGSTGGICSDGIFRDTLPGRRRKGGGGGGGGGGGDIAGKTGEEEQQVLASQQVTDPADTPEKRCIAVPGNVFSPIESGELITTGEIFNDLGYAMAFPRTSVSLHYMALSQVILYLREVGVIQALDDIWLHDPENLACAGGDTDDTVQLQVINVLGLFFVTGGLMVIGFMVGTMEYVMRCFMATLDCLCTCKSRIEQEIADAIDDAEHELGEAQPTDHELFIDWVYDAIDETQQVMDQIEKNMEKCVKFGAPHDHTKHQTHHHKHHHSHSHRSS